MTTDKELLELAAKAIGLTLYVHKNSDKFWIPVEDGSIPWNPLTDDGDALRLAVELGIKDYFGLEVQNTCVQACILEPWEQTEYEEYKTQDPYAATRRAIVRAAAVIGRNMK